MRRLRFFLPLLAVAAAPAQQEFPVVPYTDPSQIICPWPQSSHYKQPWRAFIETRRGWDFLQGIGINLHIPDGTEDLAMRLLSETGFRTARIEAGWGESNWEETGLNREARFRKRFELCAKYGIRPTILINAHQGAPCPVKFFERRIVEDAPQGATKVKLDDVSDLTIERSGLSQLTDYWAAEALIVSIDAGAREVTLSKPLPRALKAGPAPMATLKYSPLQPAGTFFFEETAAALAGHAVRVCRLARDAGVKDFDVEIWNELTFGSHFLDIDDYFARDDPKVAIPQPGALLPGGRCWELASRIQSAVKFAFPDARIVWGFSNTTFFHTPIEKLPPGIDGQSYHPYGTGTREFKGLPPRADQPPIEGFVPAYEMRMPEGWAATYVQTESLFRHLNPLDRLTRKPKDTPRFFHCMTEHGVLPTECGIHDADAAWQLKALCASRSFLFWLNKGIDTLHYYDAFEPKAESFGLLPVDLAKLPADAAFEKVATPPMRVLQNLVRTFAGSEPLGRLRPLQLKVAALGAQGKIFEGDASHPPLWEREVVAALPFQINDGKHVLALYVMTRDAAATLAPQPYRITIAGAAGGKITCYDPHAGRAVKVEVTPGGEGRIHVVLPLGGRPRLLTLSR